MKRVSLYSWFKLSWFLSIVCYSNSKKLGDNNVIEISPNKPYYGVKVHIDESYIIKVNTKYMADSRYQLKCYSAGPDPQGKFEISPFIAYKDPEIKLGKIELMMNKILPDSIFYLKDGFYTSKSERLDYFKSDSETYIAFRMNFDMKRVTYKRELESKPIFISLEFEHLKYGFPRSVYQVAGSLLLTAALTSLLYHLSVKYGLVERASNFIFPDKDDKKQD